MTGLSVPDYFRLRFQRRFDFPEFKSGLLVEVREGLEHPNYVVVGRRGSVISDFLFIAVPTEQLFRSGDSVAVVGGAEYDLELARRRAVLPQVSSGVPLLRVRLSSHGLVVEVENARCPVCRLMVDVLEHAGRCVAVRRIGFGAGPEEVRRNAWLGDALHSLDVRRVVLSRTLDSASLQPAAQRYVENAHLASMYDRVLAEGAVPLFPALGDSVRQRATAFEASYRAEFREKYLAIEFGLAPLDLDSFKFV